jgi:hypothetical protein
VFRLRQGHKCLVGRGVISHHALAKALHCRVGRLFCGHLPQLNFGETIAGCLPHKPLIFVIALGDLP